MQAQKVIGKVPRTVSPLRWRVYALYPLKQRINGFRPAFHARGLQHELGQALHDVSAERSFLVPHQIVNEVLRINVNKEWRELGVYHSAAHARRRVEVSNFPVRHVLPRMVIELVQLPRQSFTGIGRRQGLAEPEVLGAIQRGQYSRRALDLLEVRKVVLSSQVQASPPMHPAICLRSGQDDHGLGKRRPDLKHRPVLLCEVRKQRGNVAGANMPIEQHLAQGDCRNLLGQTGVSKHRAGQIVRDRSGDGPADQVHVADELDALLRLFVKLEHEAKDVARVNETDNDDVSRVWNLVVENRIADARLYELHPSAVLGVVEHFRLPGIGSQRPEVAVVVFQDIQMD